MSELSVKFDFPKFFDSTTDKPKMFTRSEDIRRDDFIFYLNLTECEIEKEKTQLKFL